MLAQVALPPCPRDEATALGHQGSSECTGPCSRAPGVARLWSACEHGPSSLVIVRVAEVLISVAEHGHTRHWRLPVNVTGLEPAAVPWPMRCWVGAASMDIYAPSVLDYLQSRMPDYLQSGMPMCSKLLVALELVVLWL